MPATYVLRPAKTKEEMAFRKQLCTRIGRFTLVALPRSHTVPLVLIVQTLDPVGTDNPIKELKVSKEQVAIVVLHVTEPHDLPSVAPNSNLFDPERYERFGCMVDFFFTLEKGIYDCRLNDEATQQLREFLKVGTWSRGLFDCCGCGEGRGLFYHLGEFRTGVFTFLCPCVTFGRTAEAMGEGDCVTCGIAYMVPVLNLVTWVRLRGKIRESGEIPGDALNDCLDITCCPLCALVQEAREFVGYEPPDVQSMNRV